MAYVKLSQIKSEGYLKRAINYILNPQKTENGLNTASYMCSTEYADLEFNEIRKQAVKKGKVIAHEIYQSFLPEDDITPQKALEIGQELMRRTFPDFQYVIATHNDKEHIHNHIIICAVNFNDFHMFPNKLATLEKVRQASNELCKKYSYSVITPNPKGHKKRLRAVIDDIIGNCDTYNDFFKELKKRGYEIKIGKYISVKGIRDKSFIRMATLGSAYTEKNIRRRIEEKTVIKNVERNVYANSTKKMPHRLRLKKNITECMKSAKSFEEFISLMKKDYSVKTGKHMAFKHTIGKRFLRLESLGEEYSEEMLRLYFSDSAEYKTRLDEISARKISRLKAADETSSRYTYSRNANTEIKMLNYLHACNIRSYEVLKENISQLEKRIADYKSDVQKINAQISARRSITNAVRDYWRYKPIYQKYLSIIDTKNKEKYLQEYSAELARYKNAVEVMNNSKIDGVLAQSANIKSEIAALADRKEDLSAEQNKLVLEWERLKTIKHNADVILGAFNRKDRCGQLRSNWLLALPKVVTEEETADTQKPIKHTRTHTAR